MVIDAARPACEKVRGLEKSHGCVSYTRVGYPTSYSLQNGNSEIFFIFSYMGSYVRVPDLYMSQILYRKKFFLYKNSLSACLTSKSGHY